LVPVIQKVPVAALAALLIFVGYRLASPATFFRAFKTGPEQLAVLLITVVVTLFTDLLLGIVAGIVVELGVNVFNGQKLHQFFRQNTRVRKMGNVVVIEVHDACTFSNWIPFQNILQRIPKGKQVLIDLSNTTLIGHTFMQNLLNYIDEYSRMEGARMEIIGTEGMKAFSKEASATRKRKRN
jgi:MFS superfamily sulfate permease-like transporter